MSSDRSELRLRVNLSVRSPRAQSVCSPTARVRSEVRLNASKYACAKKDINNHAERAARRRRMRAEIDFYLLYRICGVREANHIRSNDKPEVLERVEGHNCSSTLFRNGEFI